MIKDKLILALQERYGAAALQMGEPPHPVVVFPAKHERVGELSIWDDGDEAMVGIGEITHGHFSAEGMNLSQEEIDQQVTGKVLQFLDLLFRGKIFLWMAKNKDSDGWGLVENLEKPPFMPGYNYYYFWSGPIQRSLRMKLAGFLFKHFFNLCRLKSRD